MKKRIFLIISLVILIVAAIAIPISVALGQKNTKRVIDASFVSNQVAATITGTYQKEGADVVQMTTSDGKPAIELDGSEEQETKTFSATSIVLLPESSSVSFAYTFKNNGSTAMVVSLTLPTISQNAIVTETDGFNNDLSSSHSMTIDTNQTKTYMISISLAEAKNSFEISGNFVFNLSLA